MCLADRLIPPYLLLLVFTATWTLPSPAFSIDCGDTEACSVSVGGVSNHTFDATTDDVIHIAVRRLTGGNFNPVLRLLDGVGNSLPLTCESLNIAERRCISGALPGTDTYTIEVSDDNNAQGGTCNVTLEAISESFNGAPSATCGSGDSTQALACGGSITNTGIDVVGDTDAFVFDAMDGESVAFTMASLPGATLEPIARLFDGSGSEVALDCASQATRERVCISDILPTASTYSLVVWDSQANNAGDYNLTFETVSGDLDGFSNGPLTPVCGSTPDGTENLFCGAAALQEQIDVVADTDSFTFRGEAGEKVGIKTEASPQVQTHIRLFGPNGEVSLNGAPAGSFCADQCFSEPLPEGGTYTVLVSDSFNQDVGGYSVELNFCAVPIDPKDAYLHVDPSDPAGNALAIPLSVRGMSPGDKISIARFGAFVDTNLGNDDSTEMCGVFSASDALDVPAVLHRAIDGIDPSAGDDTECVTPPTSPGGEATDITEDFLISESGFIGSFAVEQITVPTGATYVFVAVPDETYGDNSDPNMDLRVMLIPEPSGGILLVFGGAAVVALARHRSKRRQIPSPADD